MPFLSFVDCGNVFKLVYPEFRKNVYRFQSVMFYLSLTSTCLQSYRNCKMVSRSIATGCHKVKRLCFQRKNFLLCYSLFFFILSYKSFLNKMYLLWITLFSTVNSLSLLIVEIFILMLEFKL